MCLNPMNFFLSSGKRSKQSSIISEISDDTQIQYFDFGMIESNMVAVL